MKRFLGVFLAISLFVSTNFMAQKSEAAVGFIVANKVVKVVGGISAGTGALMAGSGLIYATTTSTMKSSMLAIVGLAYGGIILGLGLIVLDDNTVADMEFVSVNAEELPEFTPETIAVYNSELEELNSIRKTMLAELSEDHDVEASKKLWNEYKSYLSPETVEVAEHQAEKFIQALQ